MSIIVRSESVYDENGTFIPVGLLANQAYVDGTSATAQSAVIDATKNRLVRIVCYAIAALAGNTIGFIEVGTNPAATASTIPMPYNGFVWEGVLDAGHKIAAYNCKIYIQKI